MLYVWTEPSVAPPGDNVPAPINVGALTQYKSGALGIDGVLRVIPMSSLTATSVSGQQHLL